MPADGGLEQGQSRTNLNVWIIKIHHEYYWSLVCEAQKGLVHGPHLQRRRLYLHVGKLRVWHVKKRFQRLAIMLGISSGEHT